MEINYAISARNIKKRIKKFELDIPEFTVPKGMATALIGENGAGKTTLLNILSGVRVDFKGEISLLGRDYKDYGVREEIGYTGSRSYFMPHWTRKQTREVSELLFEHFDPQKFDAICQELAVGEGSEYKKVSELSDGNRMKLMLAAVLARDTKLLLLDEPASPLDPLMRDRLCDMIRDYIDEGNGEKTVFFSTHNISDMENVTDYAIILEHGNVVEQGFVEELKEKYVLIKGEAEDAAEAKKYLYSCTKNQFGFEGICLAENMDKLAGMDVVAERPSLFQISVAIMKANTSLAV